MIAVALTDFSVSDEQTDPELAWQLAAGRLIDPDVDPHDVDTELEIGRLSLGV